MEFVAIRVFFGHFLEFHGLAGKEASLALGVAGLPFHAFLQEFDHELRNADTSLRCPDSRLERDRVRKRDGNVSHDTKIMLREIRVKLEFGSVDSAPKIFRASLPNPWFVSPP